MPDAPPWDLLERSLLFAAAITKLTRVLTTRSVVDRRLALQLLDAGTSIGANLEEAKDAYSRKDFAHKASIALKEAREARYWLRLLADSNKDPEIESLRGEANQLVAILTASVRTARSPLTGAKRA